MRWVVAFLLPGVAMAATPPVANEFAAVMQDAGHKQAVLDAAAQTPAWAKQACPAVKFTPAQEIGVYAQITFDPSGEPVAGEWREGILATGCGPAITLNVLTKVTAPGTLATGALLPGGTIADPVLQNAAQANAVQATGGLPIGCTGAFVADTDFGGYDGPANPALPAGEQAAPWHESWTLNLCGSVKTVVMRFAPTKDGVTINASAVP